MIQSKVYLCDICTEEIEVPGPNYGVMFIAHKRTCRKKKREKQENQLQELSKAGVEARKQNKVQPKPKEPVPPKETPSIITAKDLLEPIIQRTGLILEVNEIAPRSFQSLMRAITPVVQSTDEMSSSTRNILDDLEPDEVPNYTVEPEPKPEEIVMPNLVEPSVIVTQEQPGPITDMGQKKPIPEIEDLSSLEVKAEYLFEEKKSIVANITNFTVIRSQFLLQDKFIALEVLYDVFTLSYIEVMGGYGLTEHKKEVLVKLLMKIKATFEFLKGETRPGKKHRQLRRYTETVLFKELLGMILASSMDTLSAREADTQARMMVLAEATIAPDGDKKELRSFIERTINKEEEKK